MVPYEIAINALHVYIVEKRYGIEMKQVILLA